MSKFTASLIRVENNGHTSQTFQVVESFGDAEDTPPVGTRGMFHTLQYLWPDGAWSLNSDVTVDALTGKTNTYN